MRADIVLIAALGEEIKALVGEQGAGSGLTWVSVDSKLTIRTYHVTTIGHLRVAAVEAHGMGQLHAAMVAADAMTDLEPAVIILIGIAASVAPRVSLGDIVVANSIIDTEPGKITREKTYKDLPQYPLSAEIIGKVKSFSHSPLWAGNISVQRPVGLTAPTVHFGDFLCANKVVAAEEWVREFTDEKRKLIALEMEAAGIAAVILQRKAHKPHFVVIKGISDKADRAKEDDWHSYAAAASATFAIELLKSKQAELASLHSPRSDEFTEHEVSRLVERLNPGIHPVNGFRQALAQDLLRRTLEEVDGALARKYKANVSMGNQFLLRAAPLFGKASELYATSLDTVSTFWTDPDNRDAAQSYLRHQAPNGLAMRLFVFSTPDSAHKHAKVLDQHCETYDHVYVCSMDYYREHIVQRLISGEATSRLYERDFAVLAYATDESTPQRVFAELDSVSVRFRPLETNGTGQKLSYSGLTGLFEPWKAVPKGHFCRSEQVLRWSQNMWINPGQWSEVLKRLFRDRIPDATHMVFFRVEQKGDEEALRALLAAVKTKIMKKAASGPSIAEKYGIKQIWIGQKLGSQRVFDAQYGGTLLTTGAQVETYALIMRFDTTENLRQFYQDQAHSRIRQELYEKLDPKISMLYGAANEEADCDQKEKLYEVIEAVVGRRIHRRDYQDDESISEMVQTVSPYDPLAHDLH